MFKTQNFCHIASNNRNNVKAGVFIYRTTDDLATVSASGYFNDRIIDINLHDIIIHEQIDSSDPTKVKQNFLCVVERTLTNVTVKIMDTDEVDGANTALSNLTTTGYKNISAKGTYNSSTTYASGTVGAAIKANATGLTGKVNIDGSSVMTAPLKFASGSMRGAVGPYLNGVGFWKMDSDNAITLVATLSDSQFIPTTTNATDIGSSTKAWKDLYVARVIAGVLNNGADITVPTTGGTLALAATTLAGYGITDAYTKTEMNSSLSGKANTGLDNLSTTGKANVSAQGTYDSSATYTAGTVGAAIKGKADIATTLAGYGITDGADTNLLNLTEVGKNIASWATNLTNCIGRIPQDINLSLSSGTLTLKSGSKVYFPNGSSTFNAITTSSDLTATRADSQDCMVFVRPNYSLLVFPKALCLSGDTAPSSYQFMIWYDTANNLVKYSADTGATWVSGYSLPIGIVGTDGTQVSEIKQVFNGCGYIGKTIFVLPGLYGLCPNGRNADGSLNVSKVGPGSVVTRTDVGTSKTDTTVNYAGTYLNYGNFVVTDDGYMRNATTMAVISNQFSFAKYSTDANGTITSFAPKTVFRAVDANEIPDAITTTAISKLQNGYVKLSNGIIIQWGVTPNITENGQQVTLPTAFTSTNYSIVLTMNFSGGTNSISAYDKTTSSFKVQVGAGNYPYFFIAIGY